MCSAITMRALSLATEGPAACLDWNNNYGDDPDKVILFHCGSTAQKLMKEKGTVTSHKMFDKTDPGSGWGTNEGRIASFPMTYSNCKTEDGKITIYFSEGEFTGEDIEKEFDGKGYGAFKLAVGEAVAEGLALKIAEGKVPENLIDKNIELIKKQGRLRFLCSVLRILRVLPLA